MKLLIETTSVKYKKRLVRVLNEAGGLNGFYASVGGFSVRCNRARLNKGTLEVRSPSCSPQWFIPSTQVFTDPYGLEIVASRIN